MQNIVVILISSFHLPSTNIPRLTMTRRRRVENSGLCLLDISLNKIHYANKIRGTTENKRCFLILLIYFIVLYCNCIVYSVDFADKNIYCLQLTSQWLKVKYLVHPKYIPSSPTNKKIY